MSQEEDHPTLELPEFWFWVRKGVIACVHNAGIPRVVYVPLTVDHLLALYMDIAHALFPESERDGWVLHHVAVDDNEHGITMKAQDLALRFFIAEHNGHAAKLAWTLDQARTWDQVTSCEHRVIGE